MKTVTKIVLVDDSPAVLDGLVLLFNQYPKYKIIGRFNSGNELLEAGPEILFDSDLVLMDIEMPGKNGIETTKIINKIRPNLKVVALTMYIDKVYLEQLIESGFKGFVNKVDVCETLFPTIAAVLQNKYVFPHEINITK
jgi:DNA-binding NarL/FixJ family response regulator